MNLPCPLNENRYFPFNINMSRCHVFAGARHAVPLPRNLRICEFYEHETSFYEHEASLSSFVVPAPGMGIYGPPDF
jgi:hypothetical protein